MSLLLSQQYGVNPGLMQCFFCLEASGVILWGANRGRKAPHMACIDHQPCSKCEGYMKQGVIFVSVRDEDMEKLKWHWQCPHCHARVEKEIVGHKPSTPICDSTKECKFSAPAMRAQPDAPTQNPYRTGGFCVMSEAFVKRVVRPQELVDHMLKARFAFVPDTVWDKLGLPRGSDEKPEASGEAGQSTTG